MMSFDEIVEQLSRLDILVGAHGAGLANVFLLPNYSHVIEVTPHWMPAYYGKHARRANVSYEFVEAEPHETAVACARKSGDIELEKMLESNFRNRTRYPQHVLWPRRGCLREQDMPMRSDFPSLIVDAGRRVVAIRNAQQQAASSPRKQ
jgi:hypothetical protein